LMLISNFIEQSFAWPILESLEPHLGRERVSDVADMKTF
jgi:hypothetical protein